MDTFGGKVVSKNSMIIVWKNWMMNLVDKFNGNSQVHKLGVRFGAIIGFKTIVEKWLDNLMTRLGEKFI